MAAIGRSSSDAVPRNAKRWAERGLRSGARVD